MVWFIILSILRKKIILNTLGRIARSYKLYAGKENFLLSIIPTVFALEGSIDKKLFYD